MRFRGIALWAVAFAMASTASATAPGATGADFLNFGQGARAVGMGEAQVAVADDPYAAYWNPAGLASVVYPTLGLTYNKALEGVDQQYVSIAYPAKPGTTLDLNFTRLGMPEFNFEVQHFDGQGVRYHEARCQDFTST